VPARSRHPVRTPKGRVRAGARRRRAVARREGGRLPQSPDWLRLWRVRTAGHDSPAPSITPLRRPNRPSSLQVYPPSAGNPFSVRMFAVSRATRSLRAGTEVRGAGAARRGRSCSSGAIGALLRRARWHQTKPSSHRILAKAAGLRGRRWRGAARQSGDHPITLPLLQAGRNTKSRRPATDAMIGLSNVGTFG